MLLTTLKLFDYRFYQVLGCRREVSLIRHVSRYYSSPVLEGMRADQGNHTIFSARTASMN